MGLGLDPEGVINSELGRELGRELGAEFGGVPVPARGRGPGGVPAGEFKFLDGAGA